MMDEHKERHHRHEGPDHDRVHHDDRPYWKRAHHDWRIWTGVALMLVAMTIYIGTNNLSFVSSLQPGKARTAHLMPH
jgi:hypothetical protein